MIKMRTADILFPGINENNNKVLCELKEKLNESKKDEIWMLCLGAGVSMSVGLPNWYKLLAKITAQLLPMTGSNDNDCSESAYYRDVFQFLYGLDYDNTFLKKISDSYNGEYHATFESINVLECAEYIRNFIELSLKYSDEDNDNEVVFRKRIDSYMNYLIEQACMTDITVDKSNEEIKNTTLAAVARLMKSDKDEIIHNVITYNYDNLLETYLRRICDCKEDEIHSIVKGDELRDFGEQKEWNIYHVHGRIPIIPHPGEEMSDSVILTESDYYQQEKINYSWISVLQSYAMLRTNMIFVGFSGSDYNFRRIIKYVNQENAMTHERYIFFSVNDIVYAVFARELKNGKKIEDCIRDMNKSHSEYSYEKMFINYLIHAQSVYWKKIFNIFNFI